MAVFGLVTGTIDPTRFYMRRIIRYRYQNLGAWPNLAGLISRVQYFFVAAGKKRITVSVLLNSWSDVKRWSVSIPSTKVKSCLMILANALVSTPCMPGTPSSCSQASRLRPLDQWEGDSQASPTTKPPAAGQIEFKSSIGSG